MHINKYSIGIGDRFAHQGKSLLNAIIEASKKSVEITPVWNKSNREHSIIHTTPANTRKFADLAVHSLNYAGQYFVDADHINLSNVDRFIEFSDFFTIDVAEFIGGSDSNYSIDDAFFQQQKLLGNLKIHGINDSFSIPDIVLKEIIRKYLPAAKQASKIYRYIEGKKGNNHFVTEVSMDEVDTPQSPVELLVILSLLAAENIPLQTIAPRFSGRFNKGIDYVGNIDVFRKEFEDDLLVVDYAVQEFGLPDNLKLSIHSGSDKFSIYPVIKELLKKHNKGIHVKTAGTTWLEEVIGLAMAGNDSLKLVQKIYAGALLRMEELCAPYSQVIDILADKLPSIETVNGWTGEKFAGTLRHIPEHPDYNPSFRQLFHVAYKLAVENIDEYYYYLNKYESIVAEQVYINLYNRHLCRLFDL